MKNFSNRMLINKNIKCIIYCYLITVMRLLQTIEVANRSRKSFKRSTPASSALDLFITIKINAPTGRILSRQDPKIYLNVLLWVDTRTQLPQIALENDYADLFSRQVLYFLSQINFISQRKGFPHNSYCLLQTYHARN